MQRAFFLDRDGTINEEVGYVNHIDRFRIFPWTVEAIARANRSGWETILVSNQAGIARGYFPCSLVEEIHRALQDTLRAAGAWLDGIYFCPHHPEALIEEYRRHCDCRKPRPGMLLSAAQDHQLDLKACWVIGDRYVDAEVAHTVGAQSAMVFTGYGLGEYSYTRQRWNRPPDLLAEDLLDAVDQILKRS